jgi:membrane-bound serine protease (ClpP class)
MSLITGYELVAVLVFLGLLLLIVEAFLPGMILGTLGVILLFASAGLVFNNQGPVSGVVYSFVMSLLVMVGFILWFKLLHKTFLGRLLILDKSLAKGSNASGVNNLQLTEMYIGRKALVCTPLRPSGKILIDGKRMDARARSQFIDAGVYVNVLDVCANGFIVGPCLGEAPKLRNPRGISRVLNP